MPRSGHKYRIFTVRRALRAATAWGGLERLAQEGGVAVTSNSASTSRRARPASRRAARRLPAGSMASASAVGIALGHQQARVLVSITSGIPVTSVETHGCPAPSPRAEPSAGRRGCRPRRPRRGRRRPPPARRSRAPRPAAAGRAARTVAEPEALDLRAQLQLHLASADDLARNRRPRRQAARTRPQVGEALLLDQPPDREDQRCPPARLRVGERSRSRPL